MALGPREEALWSAARIARPAGQERLALHDPRGVPSKSSRGRVEDQVEEIWRQVDDTLRGALPPEVYRVWIEPLSPAGVAGRCPLPEGVGDGARVGAAALRRPARRRAAAAHPAVTRIELIAGDGLPGRRRYRTPRPQAELYVRRVRDRRSQPLRARRLAGGRRAARAGLQPAVHLRATRSRQDTPAPGDRQLRLALRERADRALRERRDVHQPVPRAPSSTTGSRPSSSATARSTCCCSTTSSSSRTRSAPRRSSSTRSRPRSTPAHRSCSPRTGHRPPCRLLHAPLQGTVRGRATGRARRRRARPCGAPSSGALAGPEADRAHRQRSAGPARPARRRQRALARERARPRACIRIADPAAPDRSSWPSRSLAAIAPQITRGIGHDPLHRAHPGPHLTRSARSSRTPLPRPGATVRLSMLARSPCTCAASSPTTPCLRLHCVSEAATTPPSSMPTARSSVSCSSTHPQGSLWMNSSAS